GGAVFFIGTARVVLFLPSRRWPVGLAIAITLVLVSVVVLIVANRISTRLSGARRGDLI
ncbi:ABC transporter permease, partial [Mesorhizobium sp. M2E.F.Ca.ET.166.01.1.1]